MSENPISQPFADASGEIHSVEIPMEHDVASAQDAEGMDEGLFTHLMQPLSRTFKFNRVVLDSRSLMLKCLHGADFVMSLKVVRKGGKACVKLSGADADKVFLAAKACRDHLGNWLKE